MDMEKKSAFLSKRRALKGEKIYLDDNLTPAQVAHRKENQVMMQERKENGLYI